MRDLCDTSIFDTLCQSYKTQEISLLSLTVSWWDKYNYVLCMLLKHYLINVMLKKIFIILGSFSSKKMSLITEVIIYAGCQVMVYINPSPINLEDNPFPSLVIRVNIQLDLSRD